MKQVLSSSLLVLALVTVADNSNAQGVSAAEPTAASVPTATSVAPVVREGATSEGAPAAKATEKERSVYIAISPLHLVFTTVDLTAEFNLGRRVSVAAIGTLGSVAFNRIADIQNSSLRSDGNFLLWGVGAQINYYMLGNFNSGLRAGAQVRYTDASFSSDVTDGARTEAVKGSGTGFSTGLYLGGKWTSSIGFTINGDLGLGYMHSTASASSASESVSERTSRPVVLANLNVGWSF